MSVGYDVVVVIGIPSSNTSVFFNSIKMVKAYVDMHGEDSTSRAVDAEVKKVMDAHPDYSLLNWYWFEDTRFNNGKQG